MALTKLLKKVFQRKEKETKKSYCELEEIRKTLRKDLDFLFNDNSGALTGYLTFILENIEEMETLVKKTEAVQDILIHLLGQIKEEEKRYETYHRRILGEVDTIIASANEESKFETLTEVGEKISLLLIDLKKLKEKSRLQSSKELVKLIGKKEQEIKLWEAVEEILPLQERSKDTIRAILKFISESLSDLIAKDERLFDLRKQLYNEEIYAPAAITNMAIQLKEIKRISECKKNLSSLKNYLQNLIKVLKRIEPGQKFMTFETGHTFNEFPQFSRKLTKIEEGEQIIEYRLFKDKEVLQSKIGQLIEALKNERVYDPNSKRLLSDELIEDVQKLDLLNKEIQNEESELNQLIAKINRKEKVTSEVKKLLPTINNMVSFINQIEHNLSYHEHFAAEFETILTKIDAELFRRIKDEDSGSFVRNYKRNMAEIYSGLADLLKQLRELGILKKEEEKYYTNSLLAVEARGRGAVPQLVIK